MPAWFWYLCFPIRIILHLFSITGCLVQRKKSSAWGSGKKLILRRPRHLISTYNIKNWILWFAGWNAELLMHQSLFLCGYSSIRTRRYTFMSMDIWIKFVWIFTLCTLMGTYECFEGTRCLPFQYRGVLGECAARLYRENFLSDYLPCYSHLVLHRNIVPQASNRVPYIV